MSLMLFRLLVLVFTFISVDCSENLKNIDSDRIDSNSRQMYNYVKLELLNNVGLLNFDYSRYFALLDELSAYFGKKRKKSKKNKSEKDIELEAKMKEFKELKSRMGINDNFRILFSLFENSGLFSKLMESNSSWTVNELKELGIFSDSLNFKSLLGRLDLNFTRVGYLMNSLALIHEEDELISSNLSVLSDIDIDELERLYAELKDNELRFISLFSCKSSKKRYKIGDNDYNAFIDFRGEKVKRTNHLNKKFLYLFLNPYFIISLFLNIFPVISAQSCFFYKNFYGGILNISNYRNIKNPDSIISIAFSCLNYFMLYNVFKRIYKYFSPDLFYYKLRKRFYVIKTYLEGVKKIYDVIQSQESVFSVFSNKLVKCRNLFYENEDFTKEQLEMLRLLDMIPAKLKFRLTKGNIFDLCKFFLLFDKHKSLFVDALFEIADLERYICIYKMLNDEKNKDNVCIPKFIDKDTPYMVLKDAFNPMLDFNTAVRNDIILGKDTSERMSLGYIYGMNAAGKSTILKTISTNYILAMSLGICFAKEVEMTKFKRLYLAMNIVDDINKRHSKFMSEVITVDNLIDQVVNLKEKEFIVFLSDELFSGTNNETANSFIVNILKYLLKNDNNVVTLFSSHCIDSLVLANSYSNVAVYKMDLDVNGGDLKYSYKLSRYNNIVDIPEKSNVKSELLDMSKNVAVALVNKLYRDGLIKYPRVILGTL